MSARMLNALSAIPLFATGLWAMPAAAETSPPLEVVDDSVLADQRGGFDLAGMNVSFGAQLSTYLNGQLAMQTTLEWNNTASSVTTGAQTADATKAMSTALAGASFVASPGDATTIANGGQTVLLQRTSGGLQNIILNSANGVVARQDIDATLNIKGYAPFQAGIVSGQMSSQIMSMMSAVLAARH
jgi:hypothetical protein